MIGQKIGTWVPLEVAKQEPNSDIVRSETISFDLKQISAITGVICENPFMRKVGTVTKKMFKIRTGGEWHKIFGDKHLILLIQTLHQVPIGRWKGFIQSYNEEEAERATQAKDKRLIEKSLDDHLKSKK